MASGSAWAPHRRGINMEPFWCFGWVVGPPVVAAIAIEGWVLGLAAIVVALIAAVVLSGMRYIPNNRVGVVEKLWSAEGSVPEGRIIALERRGRLPGRPAPRRPPLRPVALAVPHPQGPLVTVPQGKIGYVYARDGEPLPPSQTLGRVVACNNFQDARGVPGRRRPAPTARAVRRPARPAAGDPARRRLRDQPGAVRRHHRGRRLPPRARRASASCETLVSWQNELKRDRRLQPGRHRRHDRGARPAATRTSQIAGRHASASSPSTTARRCRRARSSPRRSATTPDDAELPQQLPGPRGVPARRRPPRPAVRAADRRHLLHQPLVRHGRADAQDGRADRLRRRGGQLLRPGRARTSPATRSATASASPRASAASGRSRSGPGKYPFNTYAGNIVLVPTTNFVLHWVTGKTETHRYDESLRSIDLVTKRRLRADAAAVGGRAHRLPEGAERHPAVRRREEADHADARPDARRLLPRHRPQEDDAASCCTSATRSSTRRARSCGGKFREFDIECVDVLIGKPDTAEAGGKIETLLEQLRLRQLSIEQIETYERQRAAAEKLRTLQRGPGAGRHADAS